MSECKHPSHNEQLPRINKIIGQLNGIKKMIEENRYCPEIITQLKAVSSACQSTEALLLEKHLSLHTLVTVCVIFIKKPNF